jgi:hypothetical protein
VREERDTGVPPRTVFVGTEGPPHCGTDSEHREKIGRHGKSADDLGVAAGRQREAGAGLRRQQLETAVLGPPIQEVWMGRRERRPTLRRIALPDTDEMLGILVRQRPQHHGVHNREECGVGADAQRKRHQGDGREAGAPHERTSAVSDVLPERLEPALPPGRFAGRRQRPRPPHLAHAQFAFEQIGLAQFGHDCTFRILWTGAAGEERPVAMVEMCRDFLDDRHLTRRIDRQVREPRRHIVPPATHAPAPRFV